MCSVCVKVFNGPKRKSAQGFKAPRVCCNFKNCNTGKSAHRHGRKPLHITLRSHKKRNLTKKDQLEKLVFFHISSESAP